MRVLRSIFDRFSTNSHALWSVVHFWIFNRSHFRSCTNLDSTSSFRPRCLLLKFFVFRAASALCAVVAWSTSITKSGRISNIGMHERTDLFGLRTIHYTTRYIWRNTIGNEWYNRPTCTRWMQSPKRTWLIIITSRRNISWDLFITSALSGFFFHSS